MEIIFEPEQVGKLDKITGTIQVQIKVLVEADPEQGGFFAVTPDVPGCATLGATPGEAVENMKEQIRFLLVEHCD